MAGDSDQSGGRAAGPAPWRTPIWLRIVLIGVVAGSIAFIIWPWRNQDVVEFNRKTSDAMVIGKTPDQIVRMLGKPHDETEYPDDAREYTYFGPTGCYCRIYFDRGVATRTFHWER